MTGYLVQRGGPGCSFLERVPFDGSEMFLAGSGQYATVYTRVAAEQRVAQWKAQYPEVRLLIDPWRRLPEIAADADCTEASDCGCLECVRARDNYEPGDPDGADLTAGERISLEREQQAAMQRDLK